MTILTTFRSGDLAAVVGASGGIGSALVDVLERSGRFAATASFTRSSTPPLELSDESSIAACAEWLRQRGELRLLVVASGILHRPGLAPEKALRQLDPVAMAELFAVNAIGPALVLKHFLPLLADNSKAVVAVLSARVGSIGDNALGGWYSYRASKAAVNQLVRTAAIELRRRRKHAACIALHPGTVATALSAPFRKSGLDVLPPCVAAQRVLAVIDRIGAVDSGEFFDQHGARVPW